MRSRITCALMVLAIAGFSPAFAQEGQAIPGRSEIAAFPGGGLVFTSSDSKSEPDFTNYALGASFTRSFNRWIGIEGEFGYGVGIRQQVKLGGTLFDDQRTPSMLSYMGNFVVSLAGNDRAVVPYATGGMGGLTLLKVGDIARFGINERSTFLTANAGGGLKWFASSRWGLRADYRLMFVGNKETAPASFGREAHRYAHRVYGGLVFTY